MITAKGHLSYFEKVLIAESGVCLSSNWANF